MLKIYDTKSKQKKEFKPIEKNKIGLYVCGVTVYDECHIGHAKAYITFDVVVRYLKSIGYDINYVRNITDIDDKIINKAQKEKVDYSVISNKYIEKMNKDYDSLNLLKPNKEPKATEFIPEMVNFVQELINKGFAYVADNKDVYYDVRKFKDYGCLSHRTLDSMQAGTRVAVNEDKRYPFDFVLWKKSKENEPKWESPWGDGRPGWHLECSVMARAFLGDTFDIHGGGSDLVFPHHENECAQSIAVTGKEFVNNWMHVGFLQINQEKMSKSLGNFSTISNILKIIHPEVLRYFMISGHYRSPLEYSEENILNSKNSLKRIYQCLRDIGIENIKEYINKNDFNFNTVNVNNKNNKDNKTKIWLDKFNTAMNDDFNTPIALSVIFELVKDININKNKVNENKYLIQLLIYMGNILGLIYYNPSEFLQDYRNSNIINKDKENNKNKTIEKIKLDKNKIEELISKRNQARAEKNWKLSDEIRDNLLQQGIVLEDKPNGTIWRAE